MPSQPSVYESISDNYSNVNKHSESQMKGRHQQTKFNFKRITSGYGKDIRNVNVDGSTALDWDGNNRFHRKEGIYNKIKESYRDRSDDVNPRKLANRRATSLPRLMSATSSDMAQEDRADN